MRGSVSSKERILNPLPDPRTLVISIGDWTSSRIEENGSEQRTIEFENGRISRTEFNDARIVGTFLERKIVGLNMWTTISMLTDKNQCRSFGNIR